MSTPDSAPQPAPPPPDNPAIALYQILQIIVEQNPDDSVANSWQTALGAPINTLEFSRRHCETVGLLDSIQTYLSVASPFNRNLYEKYVPAWFTAVVCQSAWSNTAGSSLLPVDVLSLLGALGAALPNYTSNWNETARSRLNNAIHEWSVLLDSNELPEDVAQNLRRKFQRLTWLYENVSLFGVEPVTEATSDLAATGVQGMARSRPSAIKMIGVAVAASFHFLNQMHTTVDDVKWAVEGGQAIYTHIVELTDQKQLPPPTRQLESGESDAAGQGSDSSAASSDAGGGN